MEFRRRPSNREGLFAEHFLFSVGDLNIACFIQLMRIVTYRKEFFLGKLICVCFFVNDLNAMLHPVGENCKPKEGHFFSQP